MKKTTKEFVDSFLSFVKKRRNHFQEENLLPTPPKRRSVKPLPDVEPTAEDLEGIDGE